jgi:hypothetical protein
MTTIKKTPLQDILSFLQTETFTSWEDAAQKAKFPSVFLLKKTLQENDIPLESVKRVKTLKIIDPALRALVDAEYLDLYPLLGYNGLANRYNKMGFKTNPMEMSDLIKERLPSEMLRKRGRPKGGSLANQKNMVNPEK